MLELLRRSQRLRRAPRRDRRGVLLMVVLSMLALFLLLGTAFLVNSQFYASSGKEAAKMGRTTNNSSNLLERAMLQVLRDTNNPNSAIRYHSLLRDVYGSDGFVGKVASGAATIAPRYAGSSGTAGDYGPTGGQLLELYVVDRIAPAGAIPDSSYVIKLDRNPDGTTSDYTLPAATDYFNGCLLTMLTGPAAGQTTRIVDYELMPALSTPGQPVYRLRVMAFSNADGTAIAPDQTATLADNSFMVNGRAHNGTGVGYNRFAASGTPRLSALELSLINNNSEVIGSEVALMPNLQFIDMTQVVHSVNNGIVGADSFAIPIPRANLLTAFAPFNPLDSNGNFISQLYPTAEGPGGSDESYDAVDYQNMFLAYMPLAPRARGGVINGSGVTYNIDSQDPMNPLLSGDPMRFDLENTVVPSYHRPALMNYWYHRLHQAPWLVSVFSNENDRARAILQPYGPDANRPNGADPVLDQIVAIKRKISLRPIPEDHPNFDGSNPASRYSGTLSPSDSSLSTIAASGQIRFPAWEVIGPWDVDNDNDGTGDSIWVDLGDPVQETENGRLYKPLYAFLIVDLDNRLNVNAHGSVDHFVATNFDPTLIATGGLAGNLVEGGSSNVMPVGMGWGPGDVTLRSILSPLTQPRSGDFATNFVSGDPYFDDYARLFGGRPATTLTGASVSGSTNAGYESVIGRFGSQQITARWTAGRTFNLANLNTREPTFAYEFNGYPEVDALRTARLGGAVPPTNFATSPDMRSKYATGVDYTGQPVYEAVWDSVDPVAMSGPIVPLVDDSTYEADLSMSSRRGLPASAVANDPSFLGNDDALFATSEIERVLRSYDPETGTAPSRLWDVVDAFDPSKYVLTIASNPNNPTAEERALAQANTSINRRQVTTDSYEIPVPADVVPSYITELGPDGAPGKAGVNDDGEDADDNGDDVDDVVPFPTRHPTRGTIVGEIGWYQVDPNDPRFMFFDPSTGSTGWSDDFPSYTGKSVAEARLVDVLWYRIQRDRERRGLAIYNWNNPAAVAILNNIAEQLLPPEVLAGYKMNINRPLGDGRDNNGNGIVDEPIEAGEPFVDLDGDGFRQNNEPFIDLDGDGLFYADKDEDGNIDRLALRDVNGDGVIDNNDLEPVVDNLWQQQLGTPALIDNVMSKDVTGRSVTTNGDLLRDDFHLARQLYARHLYVLAMLLADEDYLAPYDPNDAQTKHYLEFKAKELEAAGLSKFQAQVEARRKYTCRQMAQWAVNCCDFRDSDACMTPFEYDENPWDGWGCTADVAPDGTPNNTPLDTTDDTHFPLDGDPATNENHAQRIDWEQMVASGTADGAKLLTILGTNNPGPATVDNELPALDRTRNIVWGAERPELLITETLAFHDLRQEDLANSDSNATGDKTTQEGGTAAPDDDKDLDQRLHPRGSLFVELYNPWSNDGPKPVELYRYQDGSMHAVDINNDGTPDATFEGVLLNRLSTAADSSGRRSPVWRLIVVEEFPEYRNQVEADDTPIARDDGATTETHFVDRGTFRAPQYSSYDRRPVIGATATNTQFRPTDPDWEEALSTAAVAAPTVRIPMSEWQQKRTNVDNSSMVNDVEDKPTPFSRQLYSKPYPFVEREFYFTSGDHYFALDDSNNNINRNGQQRIYTDLGWQQLSQINNQMRVRIPFSFIENKDSYSLTFRFPGIPYDEKVDVGIAPILPGRYGVIGSSGTMYLPMGQEVPQPYENAVGTPRFVTTIGRFLGLAADVRAKSTTDDDLHLKRLSIVKRIELLPTRNPLVPQVFVSSNGGVPTATPGGRDNEMFYVSSAQNAFSTDGIEVDQNSQFVAPAVAIPVDDMNISEPVYGYEVSAEERDVLQTSPEWNQLAGYGEGGYTKSGGFGASNPAHYDVPFDVDEEFIREGTIPNYRVVHLQRLADPSMPWNPRPEHYAHDTTAATAPLRQQHDPSLPINPYLTVDSASVDLTVFNGTASTLNYPVDPLIRFRSQERGGAAELAARAGAPTDPLRTIWGQERASIRDQWRLEPPEAYAPADKPLTRERSRLPMSAQTDQNLRPHHFDRVFNHTLGYANRAFGDIYLRQESGVDPTGPDRHVLDPTDVDNNVETLGTATGAPRRDTSGLASTYPWFNWNNRPFVSENELLQVPASSSSRMLWEYSVMNPNDPIDPYRNDSAVLSGGAAATIGEILIGQLQDGTPVTVDDLDVNATNTARYRLSRSPFGALQNVVQSSPWHARVFRKSNDDPVPTGAPNLHRILDYVHTPSRFVATDTLLNPVAFSKNTVGSNADPRVGLLAPFNRVPDYREPGKVNLNTVVGQRLPPPTSTAGSNSIPGSGAPTVWSDVYDGLMHRVRDQNVMNGAALQSAGHFGPAWRDVALSRRGYGDTLFAAGSPTGVDTTELVLRNESPTFFANPFRSSEAYDLVPIQPLMHPDLNIGLPSLVSADASMLRSHHYQPTVDVAGIGWGVLGLDDDGNGIVDDAREAYAGPAQPTNVPLFSELSSTPAIDGTRNSAMHYMPLTRLDNLTTTRSGVFVVWVTVGYFEVLPAPDWSDTNVQQKFTNQAGGDAARGRELYNRVYPQGYQLGKELGSETGDLKRQRAFYIIDRTRPVAFKPGEDVNVENAILLRRRIE